MMQFSKSFSCGVSFKADRNFNQLAKKEQQQYYNRSFNTVVNSHQYNSFKVPSTSLLKQQQLYKKNNSHSFHTTSTKLSSALATDSAENHANTPFDFTEENMKEAKKIIAKYPPNYEKGALLPLLHLAQRQHHGWLPLAAMNKIAKILGIAPMQVYEVASFYTMYNRTPIGKHHVQVCTTTPCMLRGAYEILDVCKKHLHIDVGETTKDGMFTLGEVECAGACVNAPMLSVGDDYYEDLTEQTTIQILDAFKRGEKPKAGPQVPDRKTSEPRGGKTSLLEPPTGPFAREDL